MPMSFADRVRKRLNTIGGGSLLAGLFIFLFWDSLVYWIVSYCPSHIGHVLRYVYYKPRLKHLGRNVRIDVGVYIQNPQYVSIDDNAWIDRHVMLLAGLPMEAQYKDVTLFKENPNFKLGPGELHIGKNAHVGPFVIISGMGGFYMADDVTLSARCSVYSLTNHYRSFKNPADRSVVFGSRADIARQSLLSGPIVIEENCGLALHSVVLPGVTIHRDSFVAINSLVTSDVPPNSVVSGRPALVVKERFKTSGKDEPGG